MKMIYYNKSYLLCFLCETKSQSNIDGLFSSKLFLKWQLQTWLLFVGIEFDFLNKTINKQLI